MINAIQTLMIEEWKKKNKLLPIIKEVSLTISEREREGGKGGEKQIFKVKIVNLWDCENVIKYELDQKEEDKAGWDEKMMRLLNIEGRKVRNDISQEISFESSLEGTVSGEEKLKSNIPCKAEMAQHA